MTSLLWPRLDDAEEPLAVVLEHLDLALELAVSLSELGYLLLERGDFGLGALRAGFRGVLDDPLEPRETAIRQPRVYPKMTK